MEGERVPFEHGRAAELQALTLDALQHSVVVADARRPGWPLVYANAAFLRLTGYARDDVLGRSAGFLQGPGTDREAVASLRETLHDEQPYFCELLNYRRDGSAFWNALSIVPLHDDDGLTAWFVGTQTDVTALRERDLRDEQRGRVALLDAFARGVAHDVNNVLLAASGYAELLQGRLDEGADETLRNYAQQVVNACAGGRRLTQRLLGLGRDESVAVLPDPVDLAAVAASTLARARSLLGTGIRLHTELPAEPALVEADASQLEQVLLNLLANARDRAGGSGTLAVRVVASGEAIELSVSGPGDAPEPDDQAGGGFFTSQGGERALGLLTTTALVRRLGATLDSRPGDGTSTLVVSLPRANG